MHYCDDAYATILLTVALSANREEYARPLSTAEYRKISASVREGNLRAVGKLLGMDISGLMEACALPEEEAYRVFTLLNRSVQLIYTLEDFLRKGIEVITQFDERYPACLAERMGENAPPVLYMAGNAQLLCRPSFALMGISGVKTTPAMRETVEQMVVRAREMGCGIVTGGELGVSHLAMDLVRQSGGTLVDIVGGGLCEHAKDPAIAEMIADGRCVCLSLEHPDAMFTVSHAISRNKVLFSLCDAAFIFNTDGKRGESDALRNRLCDWIYAWDEYAANQPLISKGAKPFSGGVALELPDLFARWRASAMRQLSVFDMLDEK